MIFTEKNKDQLEKLLQPVLERKILEPVISKASCEEQALSLEEMDALLEKMGEEYVHPDVATLCIGQAASAVSILLCAGAKKEASRLAQFPCHDSSAFGRGTGSSV